MRHLVEPEELVLLGRPIGKGVSPDKLLAFITEAEQLYVKPALGDALFLDVLARGDTYEPYLLLLGGGVYEGDCGNRYELVGLKTAVAYYVYAQNVMSGDFNSTRYGMVLKDGDYSSHVSAKERSDHYNNTLEVANQYLRQCVEYCLRKGLMKRPSHNAATAGGITIRKIG